MKWSKLLANLVGNATSAILDLDPASIYADKRLYAIERRQLREALAVMRALGLRPVGAARRRRLACSLRGIVAADGDRPAARGPRRSSGARGGKSPSLRLHVRERRTADGGRAGSTARSPRRGPGPACPTPVNERARGIVEEVAADPERARSGSRADPARLVEAVAARATEPEGEAIGLYSAAVETFELVRAILIVVAAYFIGGIPWGIIVARLTGGPDPRTIGSGRTGGANVDARPRAAAGAPGGDPRPAQGHRPRCCSPASSAPARAWRSLAGHGGGHRPQPLAVPRASGAGAASRRRSAPCSRSRPSIARAHHPAVLVVIARHALLVGGLARRRRRRGRAAGGRDGGVPLGPLVLRVRGRRRGARVAVPHGQHPAPARGPGTPDRHARATRAPSRGRLPTGP